MARKFNKTNDTGHDITELILASLEDRISEEYTKAEKGVSETLEDYYARFKTKDEIKLKALSEGLISQEEYNQWKYGQLCVGQRWEALKNTLALEITHTNQIAKEIAYYTMPTIYALNFNYGTFQVEHSSGINTMFTLYNKDAISILFDDEDKLYHDAGIKLSRKIALNKDLEWNKRNIQSIMTQSILQGESIPERAKRLRENAQNSFDASDIKDANKKTADQIAKEVAEKNRKASIRNARTMTTYVENKGRENSYRRGQELGLTGKKVWMATLDGRTRHEHRVLNYQKVGIDEYFEVNGDKISEPADPEAAAYLVYNCRCRLNYEYDGFERKKYRKESYEGKTIEYKEDGELVTMTYAEWLEAKPKSQRITYQEDVGNAIRRAYIAEYRRLSK